MGWHFSRSPLYKGKENEKCQLRKVSVDQRVEYVFRYLKKNSSSVQLNSTNIYCVLAGVRAEVIKQRSYPQKLTIEWAARCMNKALTSWPSLPQGLPLPCPSQCGGGDGGPTVSPLICKRFLHGNIYMHTYIQPQNGFPKTICGCICFWVFSRNGTIVLY